MDNKVLTEIISFVISEKEHTRNNSILFSFIPLSYNKFKRSITAKHSSFRLKKSNEMQQCADIYLLLNYATCFGRPSRPSSGVHKTAVVASGTYHNIWGVGFFKRPYLVTFEEACFPDSMICTRSCNYSFMYTR